MTPDRPDDHFETEAAEYSEEPRGLLGRLPSLEIREIGAVEAGGVREFLLVETLQVADSRTTQNTSPVSGYQDILDLLRLPSNQRSEYLRNLNERLC